MPAWCADSCGLVRAADWPRLARALVLPAFATWFTFAQMGMFGQFDERFIDLQLHHAGDVYFLAGQPDRGLALWREGVERCPVRCPLAIGRLTDGFINTRRIEQGEAYLRQFLARHGSHPAGEAALARLLEARQRF